MQTVDVAETHGVPRQNALGVLMMNDREDDHVFSYIVLLQKLIHFFQAGGVKEIIDIEMEKIFPIGDSRSIMSRGVSPIIANLLDVDRLNLLQAAQVKLFFVRLLLQTVMNKNDLKVPEGLRQETFYPPFR